MKSNLSEITSGDPNYREKYQSHAIRNIRNLYNSRQKVINLFNDYAKIKSESVYKIKHGTGFKVLTPKQMLLRLPTIALAHVKASNDSQSLLNEIRQIVYSLHQSVEITKKWYNNIIKLIQL